MYVTVFPLLYENRIMKETLSVVGVCVCVCVTKTHKHYGNVHFRDLLFPIMISSSSPPVLNSTGSVTPEASHHGTKNRK